MKYLRSHIITITLILTLIIPANYSAFADLIQVTPVQPTTSDILGIKLSGPRGYTDVRVLSTMYAIQIPEGDRPGAIDITLDILATAFMGAGFYEHTVYVGNLPSGSYTISLFQKENSNVLATQEITIVSGLNVPIDISGSNIEINSANELTIHNVIRPGIIGLFWGRFEWNPQATLWQLTNYGQEDSN